MQQFQLLPLQVTMGNLQSSPELPTFDVPTSNIQQRKHLQSSTFPYLLACDFFSAQMISFGFPVLSQFWGNTNMMIYCDEQAGTNFFLFVQKKSL